MRNEHENENEQEGVDISIIEDAPRESKTLVELAIDIYYSHQQNDLYRDQNRPSRERFMECLERAAHYMVALCPEPEGLDDIMEKGLWVQRSMDIIDWLYEEDENGETNWEGAVDEYGAN